VNEFQQAYVVILIALWPLAYRHVWVMSVLTANMVANLGAAGAMDIGLLTQDHARGWMLTADLVSGAALAVKSGLARVVACGYAVSVGAYVFDLSEYTTFGIVYATAALQLGAVAIGSGGNGRRRPVRRPDHGEVSMGTQAGNSRVVSRGSGVQK
jgi:hypothetical protein